MKVNFFGNDRLFKQLKKEWLQITEDVGMSGQYLNGRYTQELEALLAQRCHRKFAVLCNSGTDALIAAHEFYQLTGTMVTNFSFLASASSISRAHGHPQFVDINQTHMSPTVADYQYVQNSSTQGLVHVEVAGSATFHADVEKYSQQQQLIMIEDAAQSFGSFCHDRPSGSFGKASALSFDPTKTLPGSSPAGCLLTNNEELYHFATQRRLHGRGKDGEFHFAGIKSLVSETEAALLVMKLNYLDQWITRRNHIAHFYSSELMNTPCKTPDTKSLSQRELKKPYHVFHKYILRLEPQHQTGLQIYLKEQGIETRQYYPRCLSSELLYKELHADTPKALELTTQTLALPIYPELTDDECQYIVSQVKYYFENAST